MFLNNGVRITSECENVSKTAAVIIAGNLTVNLLFGKTDYMAEVCSHFLEIMNALDRFHKFLGPELKAVTGDSHGIDEILKRVEGLTVPLRVPFEDKIFDKNI